MNYKIGVDFHGVINANPQYFRQLFCCALQKNIEIHIISGGPYASIASYLAKHHIPYTKLWCIFNYYAGSGEIIFLPDGSFHMNDYLWNKAKADYCRREKISVHIDDSFIYGKYFSTPYCRYDTSSHSCSIRGQIIPFTYDTRATLKMLFKSIKA